MGRRVAAALEQVKKLSDSIVTTRKRSRKEEYERQFEAIREAELAIQADWTDTGAWADLNRAQAILEGFRMEKLEASKNATAAKWVTVGDRCSKEFFEFHKAYRSKSTIKELRDGGRIINSHEEIVKYVQGYFSNLYKRDDTVDRDLEAKTRCLRSIPVLVTADENEDLTRPFTIE